MASRCYRNNGSVIFLFKFVSVMAVLVLLQSAIRERHEAAGMPYEPPRKLPLPPVVLFKEQFQHTGPNGEHMCLVFEMLGEGGDRPQCDQTELKRTVTPKRVCGFWQNGVGLKARDERRVRKGLG